jgi:exopolysaccharide biosynthesis polyprenyl glycosylphosphotransferase
VSLLPAAGGLVAAPGVPMAAACVAAVAAAALAGEQSREAAWIAVVVVAGLLVVERLATPPYDRDRTLRPVRRLLVIGGAGLLLASMTTWWGPGDVRWAAAVVAAAAAALAGVVTVRRTAEPPRTVLLVGGRVGVDELIAQWASRRDVDLRGVCLPEFVDESAQEVGLVPILGSLDDVAVIARALAVDQVVLVPGPLLTPRHVRRLSWALETLPVELSIVAELDGVAPRRVAARATGGRLTFSVLPGRRALPERWVKGVVDRVVAALLLAVLSPVLLLVAIVVRRDSPGAAVFRQTRVGLDGRPFTILKFRTMRVDAETRLAALRPLDEGAGPLFKMAEDPRITRVGRMLRHTSIDELPQLLNVVRGEMSLIGPRPGLPAETASYDDWVRRRLHVKPGMTGAWQVGGRSNLSWTDSIRLDLDYVDNATLRDDLRIAAKTARVVVSRDGAL